METIIQGLHSCKPGNEPVIGETKTFTVENKIGKSGKPYLKIKSASAERGGTPFRILEAEPTGFTDSYGNLSFNLGIEPATSTQPHQQERPVVAGTVLPYGSPAPSTVKPYSALDERQRAIIRQHSQSMAIEVLKLKVALSELTVEDITPAKLRKLTDYFDQDVIEPQTKNGGGNEREDLPEYQPEPF